MGLGEGFWAPFHTYWQSGKPEDRKVLNVISLNLGATRFQYENGAKGPIAPESPYLDYTILSRWVNAEIQLDLYYDYRENVKVYPQ